MLIETDAIALGRHLAAGNAANVARDWKSARAHYARVLELDPSLWATWVQYGHALKDFFACSTITEISATINQKHGVADGC